MGESPRSILGRVIAPIAARDMRKLGGRGAPFSGAAATVGLAVSFVALLLPWAISFTCVGIRCRPLTSPVSADPFTAAAIANPLTEHGAATTWKFVFAFFLVVAALAWIHRSICARRHLRLSWTSAVTFVGAGLVMGFAVLRFGSSAGFSSNAMVCGDLLGDCHQFTVNRQSNWLVLGLAAAGALGICLGGYLSSRMVVDEALGAVTLRAGRVARYVVPGAQLSDPLPGMDT